MHLCDIASEGNSLAELDTFRCEDLKSAYHQYALSEKSVMASGCRYKDKTYVCQTMMYGPSQCVIIADTLLKVPTTATALRHEMFLLPYIDDIFQSPSNPDHIGEHLRYLGYYLRLS